MILLYLRAFARLALVQLCRAIGHSAPPPGFRLARRPYRADTNHLARCRWCRRLFLVEVEL